MQCYALNTFWDQLSSSVYSLPYPPSHVTRAIRTENKPTVMTHRQQQHVRVLTENS